MCVYICVYIFICVCVYIYVCVCVCAKLLQSCLTLWLYELQPTKLLCLWDFLGKILGRVVVPSSRGSSQLRGRT